jgi:BirA family biotin operon repressor/biotin-[acetyl-CoA-carboxylase] ligase
VKAEDIQAKIKGDIGREIFFYEHVGSTNTVAFDLAGRTNDGAVVVADSQEKGRGRLGRSWISPPGSNIYMSIILKPDLEPMDATLITLMAAVASTRALRRTTGLDISIKWPNDLIVSEKKIGGILTDLKTAQKRILCAVVGIGINVNSDLDGFPEEVRKIATSLKNETGRTFPREELIPGLLNEMDIWYRHLKSLSREKILSAWKSLTSTLGKNVIVATGQETLAGIAESVDDAGMLLLRLPSGEMKRISSGDVIRVR